MAKKKKSHSGSQPKVLSDKNFIKQKMRLLPIGRCFCSSTFELFGIGYVIVTRQHESGKISFACYLIDSYCLGVKDTFYRLRIDDYEFDDFMSSMPETVGPCTYETAHNWVYGAVEFAEEAGIKPHSNFVYTQYFMDEDTDDIPLIEFPFGKHGVHYLVANNRLEASKYLPILKEHLGEDFDFIIQSDDYDDEDDYDDSYDDVDYDDYDEDESEETPGSFKLKDMLNDIQNSKMFRHYGPETEYAYKHPEYPSTYTTKSSDWLIDELKRKPQKKNNKEWLDKFLSLPHDLLRQDLESYLWYVLGRDCDKLDEDYNDYPDEECWAFINALLLLSDIGDESSLDVVLEIMRQSEIFSDFYLSDISSEVVGSAVYKLGRRQLDKLQSFMKESGLFHCNKIDVMSAVKYFALYDSNRREEIIEWYHELIRFAIETLPQTRYIDSCMAGFIVSDVMDLKGWELINDVTDLFATNLVDEGVCGDFDDFMKAIDEESDYESYHKLIVDLYEIYERISR